MSIRGASVFLLALLAAGAPTVSACAASPVGQEYELTSVQDSSEESSDGSSSSTHDQDALIERVMAVRPDGLELEYDLPREATADDRRRNWQLPARVLRSADGGLKLLNLPELERRLDSWLKEGQIPRSACGHWIFTWNAFKIECDPQSVLKSLEAFDLRTELREGAAYRSHDARGPGIIKRKSSGRGRSVFEVAMEADPDAIRRARAETDVVVGEISRKPVKFEDAVRERSKETVSGKIVVRFDTDSEGNLVRKTEITNLTTKRPDGETETRTVTRTIERKALSATHP